MNLYFSRNSLFCNGAILKSFREVLTRNRSFLLGLIYWVLLGSNRSFLQQSATGRKLIFLSLLCVSTGFLTRLTRTVCCHQIFKMFILVISKTKIWFLWVIVIGVLHLLWELYNSMGVIQGFFRNFDVWGLYNGGGYTPEFTVHAIGGRFLKIKIGLTI